METLGITPLPKVQTVKRIKRIKRQGWRRRWRHRHRQRGWRDRQKSGRVRQPTPVTDSEAVQAGLLEEAFCLECLTKRLLKGRTFWSCLIGRKFNSLKRGKVVQEVVTFGVVGLRRVDEEQAGSPEALHLEYIRKRLLKARTFWSCLIGRKFNSLKRGEVVQVKVTFGVVCLRRVDKEQAGSPEALLLECITNRLLKARAFSSSLIGRKFNSL